LKNRPSFVFAILTTFAAVAAIAAGIAVIGPPEQIRMQRLDSLRINNLRTLTNMITNYRRTHDSVPNTLEQLDEPGGSSINPNLKDPVTGEPYEYHAKNSSSYEVCATFQISSSENPEALYPKFWSHERGRKCFIVEVRIPVQR
jgi:type II secretory pathway pseudopilin PulG